MVVFVGMEGPGILNIPCDWFDIVLLPSIELKN
jgi:hypothetical protein